MNFELFFLVFGTVFVTEISGDKALFTISALASRFRTSGVFAGIVLAFTAKMLAAVLIGNAVASLSTILVARVSAATFLLAAIIIWLKKPDPAREPLPKAGFWRKAVVTAFATIFFSEWADAGQISTALLVARHQAPLIIWFAATLALVAKGSLALYLGVGLRRYLPAKAVRFGAIAICLAMSILSALNV